MIHWSNCTVNNFAITPNRTQTVTPISTKVPASTPIPLSITDTGFSIYVGNFNDLPITSGNGITATAYVMIHDVPEMSVHVAIENGDWDKVIGSCTTNIDVFKYKSLNNFKKNIIGDITGMAKPVYGVFSQFLSKHDAIGNRTDRMNVVFEP